MQERYIKWWTPYLSREFEMLVFGSGRGLPLIIFPTSFGRYHQNKDFGMVDSVAWFVDNDRVTVYCPDSLDLDSFYNKSIHPADRIRTHIAYENVIVHDVVDFGRREASTHRVGVCGASLGLIMPPTLPSGIPMPSVSSSASAARSRSAISSTATTTRTFTSTALTNICRTCPTHGNTTT